MRSLLVLFVASAFGALAAPPPEALPASGPLSATTMQRLLLVDAERAGNRIVAVGDRGYIVYSDDNGASWTRAKSPAAPLLTAVTFVDAKQGWAVGHDAVILATADGGETWTLQFSAPAEQRPLLDVLFVDRSRGFAVGAYGAFYETADGGKSWTARKVIPDDKHLNAIVAVGESKLMIFGEAGTILSSVDAGRTWTPLASPYKGSLFGALVAQDGAIVAFGLRGRIYRSTDGGRQWNQVDNATTATLMGGTRLAGGALVIAGGMGTVLVSRDNGRSFGAFPTGSTRVFAKALPGTSRALLLFGEAGVREAEFPVGTPAP
jgi:photosystem II stability/assembly factor-like uncharacterized protein